jgi:hypothetical protein
MQPASKGKRRRPRAERKNLDPIRTGVPPADGKIVSLLAADGKATVLN